jgi:hypothetical protein
LARQTRGAVAVEGQYSKATNIYHFVIINDNGGIPLAATDYQLLKNHGGLGLQAGLQTRHISSVRAQTYPCNRLRILAWSMSYPHLSRLSYVHLLIHCL